MSRFASLLILLLAPVLLNGAESNVRIVNYWSEWCAPCRIEIPMFNALREELMHSGIAIVGVNFDDDPRAVTLDIADELGIEFQTLTSEEVAELSLRPPDVMPTTYILSPENEVLAKLIGMQTREDILDQLRQLGISIATQ